MMFSRHCCIRLVTVAVVLCSPCTLAVETSAQSAILPPALPWQGPSEKLIVPPDHPWVTPAEASGFKTTPRYQATIDWLKRLTAVSPQLQMVSLGRSHEGRVMFMVIASAEGAATPAALRANGKPTLLAQAGIHSGEIDGKDAGLMLLRDISRAGPKSSLLTRANLLFIPILSVDGHERFSPHGRINQRGPQEMGWRTNAHNLNLNRDYAKLDTPELQAVIRVLNDWQPDLYYDLHVTDGVDYQYDITWGHNETQAYSPAITAWLDSQLTPTLEKDLKQMGHIPGPLVFAVDDQDITKGIELGPDGPRFSHAYGDLRHLPTFLVENHSLKPYHQRVLGTYVLLESTLRVLGSHGQGLRQAIQTDQQRRPSTLPLSWKMSEDSPVATQFLGVSSETALSPITGVKQIRWTGRPVKLEIPLHLSTKPDRIVRRPRAYWIPPVWTEVIERLALHGIQLERLEAGKTVHVEMVRLGDPKLATLPFEGRVMVTARSTPEERTQRFAPGSVRVSTDQPLGDLAMVLLEPQSPDSFFQWGFFLEVLQRTEYVEAYVMDPMARKMMDADPKLRQAFDAKLRDDPDFAADPRARLQWFYQRTPFFDDQWRLYPVAREF
jgi:hypothetical protein